MALEELNRTNIQALWRHMPQQPFNWPRKAAVLGGNPKQTSALDVPEGWVKPQLRRLVAPFAEAVSGTPNVGRELDVIESMLFELVKAEDLQADRFPNTYHCGTCGRFHCQQALGGAIVPEPRPDAAVHVGRDPRVRTPGAAVGTAVLQQRQGSDCADEHQDIAHQRLVLEVPQVRHPVKRAGGAAVLDMPHRPGPGRATAA